MGHMYRTNWGIGHGRKDILEAHKGPFVAHHMYSMPPYPYLATDYGTQLSLFTHHMWIGGFLIFGAAVHAAIFMGPLHIRPIGHEIWDPHFGQPAVEAFTQVGALGAVNIAYSSVYQWWLVTPTTKMEIAFRGSKMPNLVEPSFARTLQRLALASLGVITSLVAQHMYSLPAYALIAQDFTTQAILYTHHQYITGFIMTGAFAHGAIFFIRDYNLEQNEDNVFARMLDHKEVIISHLSWARLFLGFHTLGLYVHNDFMLAFGTPKK
ncbi:Photosystem I P700 chlorophyll a apoprotein A2 [Olea europaea subsp. europaea]|uniref:Photosystem I P700 chlorophyll a apoprotein A2 n=1 Tax=Olea europaea subsp. europaea TaxID=158383 RepID=A0A8S0T9C6_OLEEU|nr:Photosystem I P700 chlorophyll a apoprotein A2 [Olea europaea subsp. europaea]